MKIVIVDDEPDICFILNFELQSLGHQTVSFGTMTEALKYLENETPDAIICDFQMPRGNGLDLFLSLKEKGKEIPFYILTGEPTMDTQELLEKGVTAILFKPQDLLKLNHFFK